MNASPRIASIDWLRGFVMILMIIDHVAMAYNGQHIALDSAATYRSAVALPGAEFFTRWMTHLCAPVFVFLAGTAMAISVERKVAKAMNAQQIDGDILKRGAFIAILDPTLISLFSGKLLFQVLYAIGMAMMCMALLRRLPTGAMVLIALAWIGLGEVLVGKFWQPVTGEATPLPAAFLFATYSSAEITIKYPLLPWLAIMMLGWAFGRYLLSYKEQRTAIGPVTVLLLCGVLALLGFVVIRYMNGYGNMFLLRYDNSWQQWLHVSKYPASASYTLLELGIMSILLAAMMMLEKQIGVRENGPLLVLGQTAMFFYLVHRLVLEGSATYAGLRHFGDLSTTYIGAAIGLIVLYPLCYWYRGFKRRHSNWLLCKYI